MEKQEQDSDNLKIGNVNMEGGGYGRRFFPIVRDPSSLQQHSYYVQLGILLVLVSCVVFLASSFLKPIVIALLLSLVFAKPLYGLMRIGVPRIAASAAIVLLVLSLFAVAANILAAPAARWSKRLPQMVYELEKLVRSVGDSTLLEALARLRGEKVEQPIKDMLEEVSLVSHLLAEGPAFVAAVLVTVLLWLFFLAFGGSMLRDISSFLQRYTGFEAVEVIAMRVKQTVSDYLLAISLINFGLGICLTLVVYSFGLPNPIFWGFLGGVLNFIPYVGIMAATTLVALAALFTLPSYLDAVLAPACYYAVSAVEGSIVTPTVLGGKFNINPAFVLIWLLFWAWLWGATGALVSFPILVALRTTWKEVQRENTRKRLVPPSGEHAEPSREPRSTATFGEGKGADVPNHSQSIVVP